MKQNFFELRIMAKCTWILYINDRLGRRDLSGLACLANFLNLLQINRIRVNKLHNLKYKRFHFGTIVIYISLKLYPLESVRVIFVVNAIDKKKLKLFYRTMDWSFSLFLVQLPENFIPLSVVFSTLYQRISNLTKIVEYKLNFVWFFPF